VLQSSPLAAGPKAGDRVLSIQQPFASLIIVGKKPVENRSWKTPYRGIVWIHASNGLAFRQWSQQGFPPEIIGDLPEAHDLPRSSVLGSVELVECHGPDDEIPGLSASDFARWVGDGWVWLLRNPKALAEPIPCRGKLNLWTWPG
jgi:hypothetical protein